MIKNKYVKWIIIVFVIIFVVISAITEVLSVNEIHTHNCNIPNCIICTLIQISTNYLRNIEFVEFRFLIIIIFFSLIKSLKNKIEILKKSTLVELKVIQIK